MPAKGTLNSSTNLPGGAPIYTRGTPGTDQNWTTARVEQKLVLYETLKNFQFARNQWLVQAPVPKNNNELVRWRVRNRATGTVYRLKDGGLQNGTLAPAGSNTDPNLGAFNLATQAFTVAQTDNALPVSIALNDGAVTATPNKYGIIYRYAVEEQSVALPNADPVAEACEEIGLACGMHFDALVRAFMDTVATNWYPRTAITGIAGDQWTISTDTFTFKNLVRLQAYIRTNALQPPKGEKRFPLVVPPKLVANLVLDSATQTLLNNTSNRGDVLAKPYMDGYIGSLLCFDIYESQRIPATTLRTTAQIPGYATYLFVNQAIGCVSMEDPDYGRMPGSGFDDGAFEIRDGQNLPMPIDLIKHTPGTSGITDPYNEVGTVAAKWTYAFVNLFSDRVIRPIFADDTGNMDWGVTAGSAAGTVR